METERIKLVQSLMYMMMMMNTMYSRNIFLNPLSDLGEQKRVTEKIQNSSYGSRRAQAMIW